MAKDSSTLMADIKNKPKTQESRQRKTQLSTAGIETVRRIVDRMKPYELSQSQRLLTYQAMMQDPDVFTPYFANTVMIEKAFANYSIEYNKHSEKSKEVYDFMQYCINGVLKQTPRSFAGKAATFKRDKLALFEKSWLKGETGSGYEDAWCISDLSYIDPLTLDTAVPFAIRSEGDRIQSARQRANAFDDSSDSVTSRAKQTKDGFVYIPSNKLTFVSDGGSDLNPFGISTFDAIYSEWRYKTLIKEVTLTGVTKDFSGTPVLYIPSWLQEGANDDANGWEADFLTNLQNDMANMHVGDQSYVSLPSDPHEGATSMREFEIKFLGVEGGGKAFNVVELMDQSKKAIYNAFGAANLLAGDGSGGSYNQIEGQNTIHSHFVERDIAIIEEAWNRDIWAQTFRLNGFKLKWDEVPKFKAGAIEPVSLDELGKFFNRTMRALPAHPDVVNHLLEVQGIAYRVPEETTAEEIREMLFDFQEESKTGTGEGSSGQGSSTQGNSDTNSENTA